MSSIVETIQKRTTFFTANQTQLPLSQTTKTLRRRLSSLSLNINNPISCSSTSSWRFPRSKSFSYMGEFAGTSVRKWWDWGWNWILSRKPAFPKDLELNEHQTAFIGSSSSSTGSWRRVFYKIRSDLKKIVGSDDVSLPQTCRYDSYNYSKNFDDGNNISNRFQY